MTTASIALRRDMAVILTDPSTREDCETSNIHQKPEQQQLQKQQNRRPNGAKHKYLSPKKDKHHDVENTTPSRARTITVLDEDDDIRSAPHIYHDNEDSPSPSPTNPDLEQPFSYDELLANPNFAPRTPPHTPQIISSSSTDEAAPNNNENSNNDDTAVRSPEFRNHNNLLLLIPSEDSDDIEHNVSHAGDVYVDDEHHDDPYVYSDDSESLSDAYFFPQPNNSLPRRHTSLTTPLHLVPDDHPHNPHYRQNPYYRYYSNGPLSQNPGESTSIIANPHGSMSPTRGTVSYGSLMYSSSSTSELQYSPSSTSGPFSSGTTILEDRAVEQIDTPLPFVAPNLQQHQKVKPPKWLSKQQHRKLQKRNLLQQQRIARERAVSQIKGKQQPQDQCHDTVFAVMFLMQLVTVMWCAWYYGQTLVHPLKWETMSFPSFGASSGSASESESDSTIDGIQDDEILFTFVDSNSNFTVFTNNTNGDSQQFQIAPFSIDYQNVIMLFSISGLYASLSSYLTFAFMLIIARSLIQITLVTSVLLASAWGILGIAASDPYGVISLLGFSAVVITTFYTIWNWNRIPFAATNLYTAVCALRCTADITILGMATVAISLAWCLIWAIALIGRVNSINEEDCKYGDQCYPHMSFRHFFLYVVLFLSFVWTQMVIKNVARVTVASVVGTWWFSPQNIGHCCGGSVSKPLGRSLTKSFGSICLGSLIVLPAQIISILFSFGCWITGAGAGQHEAMATARTGNATSSLSPSSSATALAQFVDENDEADDNGAMIVWERVSRSLRCCNRWAYSYVGMYGYSFAEGGEKAIQLFETREWMEVVRDNLIQNVLLVASIVIGGSTGVFAVLAEEVDGYTFTTFHKPIITSFFIGSILGFVLSNVLLLGVVGSAVNTVLVCFAAGPFEFDKNHPRLSREMREVWSQQVWEP